MKKKVKIIIGLLVVLVIVITAGFLTKKWWAGADVISNNSLKTAQTDLAQSSIVKVKIPAGITKKDIENIARQKNKDKSKEDLLNNAVEQKFDELEPQITQIEKAQSATVPNQNQASFQDYIIVFTDENNNPILPNAEKDQSLTSTFQNREKNELTFTWDSSWNTIDPKDLKNLKDTLAKAYPEIKKVYGRPAFNITVNIRYSSSVSGGFYSTFSNEAVLGFPSQSLLIHEVIHAFRDDYVLWGKTWEEGMTQLTTSQVEYALQLKNPSYIAWANYEYKNRPDISSNALSACASGQAFDPYVDGAAVWLKLLLEDNDFLLNFNKKYYYIRRNLLDDHIQEDPSWLVKQIKPEVEKELFIDWYHKQYIFHQRSFGYQLGSRVWNDFIGQYLELTYTKTNWDKSYYSVVKDGIKIQIYGPENELIYDKIQMVNDEGKYPWLELYNILDNSGIKQGRFRIELSAKAESDDWKLKSTNYVFYLKDMKTQAGSSIYAAIYGVIDNKNNGQVKIQSLSRSDLKPVTVSVDDGIFYTAEFAGTAGLFQLDYTSPDGKTTATRYFTKDYRSSLGLPYYYVFVSTDKEKPTLEQKVKQTNNHSATFQIKTNEKSITYVMINENKDNIIKRNIDFFKKVIQENTNQDYVVTRLQRNTTYYYQIWAIDFAGNITKSEIQTLKTTDEPSAKLISAKPLNKAKNVSADLSKIELQFDNDLDKQSVNKSNVFFTPPTGEDGPNIPYPKYELSYDQTNKKIIVDIKSKLEYNMDYYFVTSLLRDNKGNVVENLDYSFTTQTAPGSVAPKIESIKPAKNSENNLLNTTIEITFNNEIVLSDLNNIFFVNLRNINDSGIISGKTTLNDGKKLIFTPDKPLPKNRWIFVNSFFNFKDKTGNWIVPYYKNWKFITGEN